MRFKPKTWKLGNHITIRMTPEKFNIKGLLELVVLIIAIGLIIWWLV